MPYLTLRDALDIVFWPVPAAARHVTRPGGPLLVSRDAAHPLPWESFLRAANAVAAYSGPSWLARVCPGDVVWIEEG